MIQNEKKQQGSAIPLYDCRGKKQETNNTAKTLIILLYADKKWEETMDKKGVGNGHIQL